MDLERILVDSEALRGIAARLYSHVASIGSIEETMELLVSESGDDWKGNAKEEAAKDFKKIKKRGRELKDQLTLRAKSIEEVCAAYESTEQKSLSNVGSLSVEHIFG